MSAQAQVYVGTSGWSYPGGEGTWTGHFYPKGRVDELEYYSRFFNAVELNSSFYAPPNPLYVQNWARKVPDGFTFTVKLWQKFTHPRIYEKATGRDATISQEDIDIFKSCIGPLAEHGKLGALLAQFPPGFVNDDHGQQILKAVIRTFGQHRLAVELRHRSWSDDPNIAKLLKGNNVAWVHIDEPKFKSSVGTKVPLTADFAYFRFHGRNAEMWWKGDSETRYKYLYSPQEIDELALKVEAASKKVKLVFAFFNNHWQGYAPRNAVDLLRALKLPLKELPMQALIEDENAGKPAKRAGAQLPLNEGDL
ncbi:MAG: DUF72 domain-containing protein [Chloroflexi bacterium]|nr:DUF72 domain-containing protein [Chloroflexota bacterium]